MEFETIKRDNRKKWILGTAAVLAIASVVFFVSTRANYKDEQRLNLINTKVNWNLTDLEIVSIKVKDGDGYTDTNTVPTSGYILSDESYCEVNGSKDTSIPIEYKDGKVNIGISKKGTKCYLTFEVKSPTAAEIILTNKTVEERTDFGVALSENTTGKIYKAQDDDGDTYYFAGSVNNNWVKFGTENGSDILWRIVRINGDGSIRLIKSTLLNNGTKYKFSHKDAYTTSSTDNAYTKDNAYVGYMYGTAGSNTYEETHANINSSYVKQVVDDWYVINLNKEGIQEYIDTNAGFCGDRSLVSGTGTGATNTTYGFATRYNDKQPSFKCSQQNDLYTVNISNKGNKALTYPIGLITADEVLFSGAYRSDGFGPYIYINAEFWTMTPYKFDTNGSIFADMKVVGYTSFNGLSSVKFTYGIRPVINLKADTMLIGEGTTTNPYTVK